MSKKYAWAAIVIVVVAITAWGLTRPRSRTTGGQNATPDPMTREMPGPTPDAASVSPSEQTTLVAAKPVIDRTSGYVGSDSCKPCHEDYHQSWHTSYHRTMTQPITPATAPAAINGSQVQVEGQVYRFSRRGDEFFVELNDPIADGDRLTRRLVLMTGSHHMHIFWYESGLEQTPAQLPILFLIDQQRWIPRRSAFLRPPNMDKEHELGRWNETCCQCHSTHPRTRPQPNESAWDTRVSEFGISCEACHGPGEGHIIVHSSGPAKPQRLEGSGPAVDEIVNPKNLPASTRSDLCGQCHGIMMVDIDNAADQEQFFTQGRQFRPGDNLEEAFFLQVVRGSEENWDSPTFQRFNAMPGKFHGHFWPDGEVRVSGRDYTGMIESKCFQQGELACLSCHTMHQQDLSLQSEWKDDQLKPDMRGDAACLQCHPKYAELGSQHTHHPIDSAGSRCMNCHMPHTVYGILKTIRSHTISSPSVATTIDTGRPNACNLCHLDHTLEQTATSLADWYGHDKPDLAPIEQVTAASLLYFLGGDAAQRVLQVNAMEWQPAREASGTDWMSFYLLLGMEDPYDAIRLISERAYKSLPGAAPLQYDFLASPQQRAASLRREYQTLLQSRLPSRQALLIGPDGLLDRSRFGFLTQQRNGRPVYLQE
ncbi:hypothetical protein Mal15_68410 [Stieleria maiorica]|uniref:Cytochrome c-552/4 domain-containing protein n=1 Tax=Stieleria maiorica TaxID=2795974 RepID=A0A5B9MQL0_9BACT|nr:cytochrome c3 family protein [Stieleria maiorica]QEG02720.1 hypothetical protein Mal15_68410 [Stieleria maiorica]